MGIFFREKSKKGRPKKRAKTLKEILSDALTKEVNRDPELKRELALREGGYADLLDRDRTVEEQKKQIKQFITAKALEQIQGDPELAEQFVEAQVEAILSEGKPIRRHRGESEYYPESGSAITQAVEELESLGEFKEKLAELGMTEGGKQGFFSGMTMKDLLDVIPHIASLMGKGQGGNGQICRTYIVRVDGKDQELNESQYAQLLQQGRIAPVAVIEQPRKPTQVQGQLELTKKTRAEKVPDLSWLEGLNFDVLNAWLDQEPQEFVLKLKSEVDQGTEQSKLIWGLLTSTTVEGITGYIAPYKDNPKISIFVERLLSDEGQEWLSSVIELVKSIEQKIKS